MQPWGRPPLQPSPQPAKRQQLDPAQRREQQLQKAQDAAALLAANPVGSDGLRLLLLRKTKKEKGPLTAYLRHHARPATSNESGPASLLHEALQEVQEVVFHK